MTLKLYNTMTRSKEDFQPHNDGKVRMYVCGVTVYDMCHVGHARSQIVFDTIYRYLRYRKFDVNYVRNFTDIDDKIINRANQTGQKVKDVTEKFIVEFYRDMDALAVLRPSIEPKATEHISNIIDHVKKLEENGHAYEIDGDVYFEVKTFPPYGKLSNRKVEDLQAGARVDVDRRKRSPVDFALWKKSKPDEPSWESPWGEGRPGWHIECSAMSIKHLGDSFDIHGGGEDLIFPHHENEIAQSEAVTKKPFVKYWIHNGFVRINSEKMSKSLGNFFTIREVLEIYPPEAIRLFILSAHYRSPIDYSDRALSEAMTALDRLYQAWEVFESELPEVVDVNLEELDKKGRKLDKQLDKILSDFEESMDDDFNTAKAIGHLFELVRVVNTLGQWPGNKPGRESLLAKSRWMFLTFRGILGVPWRKPTKFRAHQKTQWLSKNNLKDSDIMDKIEARQKARLNKNFELADTIRGELVELGIEIKDTADGAVWSVCFKDDKKNK